MLTWLNGLSLIVGGVAIGLILEALKSPFEQFWQSRIRKFFRLAFIVGLVLISIAAQTWILRSGKSDVPGHLRVCAIGVGSIPANPATLVLYTEDWTYIGPKTTDSQGCTKLWENLRPGQYNVEFYSPGRDGSWWGSDQIKVEPSVVTKALVERKMPYFRTVSPLPNRIKRRDSILASVEVANPSPNGWETRANLQIKAAEKYLLADALSEEILLEGNTAAPLTVEFPGLEVGHYRISYSIEAFLPWSKQWVKTDDLVRQDSLEVQ